MKKIAGLFALLVILAGCSRSNDGDVLVIGDRFFVHQVHSILLNPPRYLGRTIQYEGIFRAVRWRGAGEDHIVMRYTMGCCGEEPVGFFVLLSDELSPFPPDQAWVQITGLVEIHEGSLMIRATSLVQRDERGARMVASP